MLVEARVATPGPCRPTLSQLLVHHYCCRFYFLSNDELLEILSEAKDPLAVQPFVKKCFEAVKELVFESNGEISGMISLEGEKIPFVESVNPAASGEF